METVRGSQLLDMIGKMKAATVIIGIFALGFCAASYDRSSSMDEFALAMICIAFIFSFFFVAAVLLGVIPITEIWRRIDMVYHLTLGLLLSLATLFMLIRLIDASDLGKGEGTLRRDPWRLSSTL